MVMAKTFIPVMTDPSVRRRRRLLIVAAGAVAVVAATTITVAFLQAPPSSAVVHAAAHVAASAQPAPLVTPSAAFTASPSFFPPANGAGHVAISQATAVSSARQQAVSSTGAALSTVEMAALPTFSRLMSYAEAVKLTRDGADPRIDPSRQVWVVTVLGHHPIDTYFGEKVNPMADKYTIISDATTGFPILAVYGLAALSH
jgi:hypothetical protein